jgi:hypothetical protein
MLAYFALLPVLWTQLISRCPMPVRWAICFLMFFSGFISILGGMSGRNKGHGIGAVSKMDTIESAIRHIPTSERFGTYPTWNHPLLLIGRKVAMGFPGHIFSHGIGSAERDRKMEDLMKGEPNWRELARDLNVRYIFWGEMERENYKESKQPWLTESVRVAHCEWGDVFDLSILTPTR